jgi:hypothetical protein
MHNSIWFWVLIFAIPIVAIVFSSLEKMNRVRVLGKLAERGQTIPPELFRDIREPHGRGHTLRGGIVTMFVGIGLAAMLWAMTGASGHVHGLMDPTLDWLPAVGAIPFAVGVGLIIASFFERKDPS